MIITIRFIDWVLFFSVFFLWGIDHWFTTYGLKMLTILCKAEFISHPIECFAMITVFIATAYIVFKLYYQSFFSGILALFYTLFIAIMTYFWNSFLMRDQLMPAAAIALLNCIVTVIGTMIISRLNIKFFLLTIPLLLWRIFLFSINVFCMNLYK